MKKYLKIFIIAIICGIMGTIKYATFLDKVSVSEIIGYFAFEGIYPALTFLSDLTQRFIPLIFFQIFLGTYIYRHFCTASIYYFSRNTRRLSWYTKELIAMSVLCITYIVIIQITAVLSGMVVTKVIVDKRAISECIYYTITHSLYLFMTTLLINIISIISGNLIGFVSVEIVNMFCMVTYCITENIFSKSGQLATLGAMIIRLNPFRYICFGYNQQSVDYIKCMIVNFIFSFIITIIGFVVIDRHEFIRVVE